MTISSTDRRETDSAFDLKGGSFTLPVLQLRDLDMATVSRQLGERVSQAPDFFHNAPVVIDLQKLNGPDHGVDFASLVGMLRGYGMIPVGVRGANSQQNETASAFELAVLADARRERAPSPSNETSTAVARPPSSPPPASSPQPVEPPAAVQSKIITRTVRSGQRIYVKQGDLIVLSSVSSGAELIAEGNIHVYGVLGGRALAGVNGNTQARIFCQAMMAELVSIAGTYRVSEDIEDSVRSLAVQVFLDGKRLRIHPL